MVPIVEARRPETRFVPIDPERTTPSASVGSVARPEARHFALRTQPTPAVPLQPAPAAVVEVSAVPVAEVPRVPN